MNWNRLFALTSVLVLVAVAAPAVAQQTGVLAGQVIDEADGQPLIGADVTVEGTDIKGITDRSGRYRLRGVPVGEQAVKVELAGFGETSGTVTVVAGQVTTHNVRLPLTIAETIAVFGIEYGARKAIADQKASNTLVTIVSEETLENLPDQSIGESLSRIPGVALQKDRGEAERIFVRGTDSRLNAVTINGDRLPSPESTVAGAWSRGNRSVRLNTVPATLIGEIQVYKAVPANLDADSVGGAVNIVTKSPAELSGQLLDITVRGGENDLPEKSVASAELNYGNRLNTEGTWGMLVSLSHEENNRGVQGLGAEWDTTDELLDLATGNDVDLGFDGHVIADYDIIWRDLERVRQGLNLTFDNQAFENSLFRFGGFWSEFEDTELRRRLQLRPGGSSDFTTDTQFNSDGVAVSGSVDGGRVRRRVRPGVKVQETYNYFLQGGHLFGGAKWTFDWRLSNTFASRTLNRTRTRWEARAQDIGLRGDGLADYTFTNGDRDLVLYGQPAWSNDPNVLQFGRRGDYLQRLNDDSEDEIQAIKVDLSRYLDMGSGDVELQFGYKGRFRDRSQLNKLFEYDGDSGNPVFMARALGANQTTPVTPFGQQTGIWGDQSIMDALFRTNPELFDFDGDNTEEDYFIDEEIHAGYVMATFSREKWTTILGLRYEDTETIVTARDGTGIHDYDDFFPSVIVRYQASDKSIIRGAWTNSIGRPDFTDLRPFFETDFVFELSDDTGLPEGELTLVGGNPELNPFEARSFDLSYEYYLQNGGVFSAGVFYKEIDNFEYVEELRTTGVSISGLPPHLQNIANQVVADAREDNPDIPADFDTLARFNYARPVNGDVADIKGFEVNWQQRFDALPAPWDRFGVFANLTLVDGTSDITTGISRDFLIGQFDEVANLQLFWEDKRVSARVAYNRNGVTYETLGLGVDGGLVVDGPIDDVARDAEESIDLAFQFHINPHFTTFFDVRNVTDEDSVRRFAGSRGTIRRFIELENGGRSFILGLRYRL